MPEPGAEQNRPIETQEQIISRQAAEIADLKSRLAESEAELKVAKENAATDSLTGLPNRRVLEIELEQKLSLMKREGGGVAVAMFDLDNFKKVNDSFGHPQGDAVLMGFAERAKSCTRGNDIVGRWGGEEFLAVISIPDGISVDDVQSHILSRYHEILKDLNRTGNDKEFVPQTVSIGCAIIEGKQTKTLSEVILAADRLLYNSKTTGKSKSTSEII